MTVFTSECIEPTLIFESQAVNCKTANRLKIKSFRCAVKFGVFDIQTSFVCHFALFEKS